VFRATSAALGPPLGCRCRRKTRLEFWEKLHPRLARLTNRLDGEAPAKILAALHERVPMVTGDERRAQFFLYISFATPKPLNGLAQAKGSKVFRPQCRLSDAKQTIGFFVGPVPQPTFSSGLLEKAG
jgi:hypothetical protein